MSKKMSPEEVTKQFGKLFCRGVYTIVDEAHRKAMIIEDCSAKGPVEWDAINRKRAGGVITDVRVEGTTLIMNSLIGEREIKFGPASKDLGGQGLKALKVEGDKVKTTWVGLAGASVGIGACLPQGPGTIEVEYPEEVKIGGAHRVEVSITTPKMIRVIYGVDDTDTKERGASWSMVLKMARSAPVGHFLEHKIIQLNPNVPEKTTNCVSVGVSFAVTEKDLPQLTQYVIQYLKENTLSQHTVLAVFIGLDIPEEVQSYAWKAKSVIYTIEDARKVAQRNRIDLIEVTGKRGMIGAVAAVGCFDMGLKSAGLPEDFES